MAIAGSVSRRIREPNSNIRMKEKWAAVGSISQRNSVGSGKKNWAQSPDSQKGAVPNGLKNMAGPTRLELATSCVTVLKIEKQ
jgi:hypothetical protein